jgi:hypothetical protein
MEENILLHSLVTLIPRNKTIGTHFIGGRVGSKFDLEASK